VKRPLYLLAVVLGAVLATAFLPARAAAAPTVVDPNLAVRTAASGLDQPISIAFLGPNDMLVLEKATGKVQRVVNGVVQSTVLDLPVNSASEDCSGLRCIRTSSSPAGCTSTGPRP
jgi:glucose/arabinose dehydrogenase